MFYKSLLTEIMFGSALDITCKYSENAVFRKLEDNGESGTNIEEYVAVMYVPLLNVPSQVLKSLKKTDNRSYITPTWIDRMIAFDETTIHDYRGYFWNVQSRNR